MTLSYATDHPIPVTDLYARAFGPYYRQAISKNRRGMLHALGLLVVIEEMERDQASETPVEVVEEPREAGIDDETRVALVTVLEARVAYLSGQGE